MYLCRVNTIIYPTRSSKDLDAALKTRIDDKQKTLDKAHDANLMAAAGRDKHTGYTGKHDAALVAKYTAEVAAMNRLQVTSAATKIEIKDVVLRCAAAWAKPGERKARPSKTYVDRLKNGTMPLTVAEKLLAKVCKRNNGGGVLCSIPVSFSFPPLLSVPEPVLLYIRYGAGRSCNICRRSCKCFELKSKQS